MAELIIPGVWQQVRLIARLRWMLFKNSLRNIKGRLEAVGTGILWLMMSGFVFGGAIFLGFATYLLIREGHERWLAGLLWLIFLFWQLYPIFAASVGAQFDFSSLLRFPLRFGSFFALSLVYGLFDPGAVASLVWLFAMWIALTFARPGLFLWGFLVLLAFAAMNLFFARMLFAWIEKWLARRRTREIVGFIFILVIISFQLIAPAVQHFQHNHTQLESAWLLKLVSVSNALPAGVAGRALQFGITGPFIAAIDSFLFLLLYAAAFLWLFRARLTAQFRGENLSETSAAPTAPALRSKSTARSIPAAAASARSWRFPGLSRASLAMFEKELRYALRSGPMLLNLFIPLILVVIFGVTARGQTKGDFFHRVPHFVFPVAVAYTFLIQVNWVFNSFAFEGTGIQFLLLAPVRFRDLLIGKNLFFGVVTFVQALLVLLAVTWIFSPPPTTIALATFAGLLYGTLGNFALGNILSVCYPRRLEFGAMRQKRQAGVTLAAAFPMQALIIGIGALVFALANWLHRSALAIFIFLGLSVLTGIAYRISLSRIDAITLNHREVLTAELCRQE